MKDRMGEKIGWIGGFSGGFLWLLLLGVVWIIQGQKVTGIAAVCVFAAAEMVILFSVPWKWQDTPYWKLMLPVYLFFLAGSGLAVWKYLPVMSDFQYLQLFSLLPVFLPFFLMGKRTWNS